MIKIRAKFYKTGSMRFIGHLDIMRYFQKAFKRAEIDISYSQGFNPHQLLSFASPLGVGHSSEGEYLDIQLDSLSDLEIIKDKLNKEMNHELQIIHMVKLPEESKTSMAILAGADYLISVKDGYPFLSDFQEKFLSFMKQEQILIHKKTKKGEMEIDLKDYIYDYGFDWNVSPVAINYENGNKLFLQLTCGSVHNIKPELVLEEFLKSFDFPYNPYAYQIHRMEMYTDANALKGEVNLNSSNKKRELVPLDFVKGDIQPPPFDSLILYS